MSRELTAQEKQKIKQSVIRQCANYDNDYKICLPEDGTCYMMTIGFTDSELCRYYEKAILPIEVEIKRMFNQDFSSLKECKICKKKFIPYKNQRYCSPQCADIATKKCIAKRVRKHRKNMHTM